MQSVGGVADRGARRRWRTACITLVTLALLGCGPDDGSGENCHRQPTFRVSVVTQTGAFPPDTRLSFEYGSGPEYFALDETPNPQVVFCETHPPRALGEAGAPSEPEVVTKIVCELWTGGTTTIDASATALIPIEEYTLQTKRGICTVEETIELRSLTDDDDDD